jgi:hypothetical protein
MKNSRIYDLEDRFINYAVSTSDLAEELPHSRLGNYLANQLIGSGTSPALNYRKELRETKICIKIIIRKELFRDIQFQNDLLKESGELIAIVITSIKTTKSSP